MENVRGIVNEILDQRGWRGPVLERMAVELWPEVVGENIARNAIAERFKNGVLYVRVRSPQWTHELHFLEARLVTRLNGRLRQQIVQKIRCSITTPPGMRQKQLKPDWEDPSFPKAPPLPRQLKVSENDAAAQHAREIVAKIEDPEMRAVMERLIATTMRSNEAKNQEDSAK
ncbi:MAG TPA: DUF721 domain-containing protein [Abditibacteriaceae bacterium]|jgi:hypothetical protein